MARKPERKKQEEKARKPSPKRKAVIKEKDQGSSDVPSAEISKEPQAPQSEVPLISHQEDGATSNENARLSNGQQGKQYAPTANGMALRVTDESKEPPKPTEHPKNPGSEQPPAKPTARDDKRRHDRCTLITAIVSSAGTAVSAGIAMITLLVVNCQLGSMRQQSSIMSGQLEQMRDADRPWVGLASTDRMFDPLRSVPYFVNEYAQVDCTVMLQNFGRSPAEIVSRRTELIVTQDGNDVAKRLNAIRSEPLPSGVVCVLFPGMDRATERKTPKTTVAKRIHVSNRDAAFEAHLIVYIVYRSPSGGECHRSVFIYWLYDTENACAMRLNPPNNVDALLVAKSCEWQLYSAYAD